MTSPSPHSGADLNPGDSRSREAHAGLAPGPPPGRMAALILGFALMLGALFLFSYLPKRKATQALSAEKDHAALAPIKVDVIAPKARGGKRKLSLPGTVKPLEETVISPRASGYVRRWRVDIGDRVEAGTVLAEIDTPELDQQLEQAHATLAQRDAALLQAKANLGYARVELKRYEALAPSGVASQQELEQKRAQAAVEEANLAAAEAARLGQQASIRQLKELKSFSRISAPFAGTITSRTVERGALVTAGNGNPLFRLAATDPVRVLVEVPQDLAPSVRAGLDAAISVREYPGRAFGGQIARAAGALDTASRTMTTEIRVPNPRGELLAGMYAEVSLTLEVAHRIWLVPTSALISTAEGQHVAVVDPNQRVHLVAVGVERDNGAEVEISQGLEGSERIVKNPGARIREGVEVQVAEPLAKQ